MEAMNAPQEINVRRMAESDLEQVEAMEKQIFSDPWGYDSFKTDLQNDMAWPLVAAHGDVVVGYACNYIVADEAQMANFAVASPYRQRGVARMLMDEIIKIATERKCAEIYLEVRESNMAAHALYASYGFKTVGMRNKYYRNPRENAIIMAKEL